MHASVHSEPRTEAFVDFTSAFAWRPHLIRAADDTAVQWPKPQAHFCSLWRIHVSVTLRSHPIANKDSDGSRTRPVSLWSVRSSELTAVDINMKFFLIGPTQIYEFSLNVSKGVVDSVEAYGLPGYDTASVKVQMRRVRVRVRVIVCPADQTKTVCPLNF